MGLGAFMPGEQSKYIYIPVTVKSRVQYTPSGVRAT